MQNFQGTSNDGSIDFHIAFDKETKEFMADIFHSAIPDIDVAYIETIEFGSMSEAVADLRQYKLQAAPI